MIGLYNLGLPQVPDDFMQREVMKGSMLECRQRRLCARYPAHCVKRRSF